MASMRDNFSAASSSLAALAARLFAFAANAFLDGTRIVDFLSRRAKRSAVVVEKERALC